MAMSTMAISACVVLQLVEQLTTRGGGTNHFYLRHADKQRIHPFAKQLVVVGQDYPDLFLIFNHSLSFF
jgi:hypothetical protein